MLCRSGSISMMPVALRKESVDRNAGGWGRNGFGSNVALRKESVDRNLSCSSADRYANGSLSARRAWIEISSSGQVFRGIRVALRKESVDRNPSGKDCCVKLFPVALRKESVDRNSEQVIQRAAFERRSPQGERG